MPIINHILNIISNTPTDKPPKQKVAIGIDLGTTFSCGAIITSAGESTFQYLDFDQHQTIPSVIRADYENGKVRYTAGRPAFHLNYNNPRANSYYYAFKTLLGYASLKEKGLYNRLKDKLHYRVKTQKGQRDLNNNMEITNLYMPVFDEHNNEVAQLTALDASTKILRLFKEKLDEQNMEAQGCIITIPAYFNDNQREATETAGKTAGLNVLGTIKEPVAAAIAYQIKHKQKDTKHEKFLVVDVGGGTTDLSVIDSHQGYMEVKAYAGSTFLGGEDINNNLNTFLEEQLKTKHQVVLTDVLDKQRLRGFVEEFKVNFCNYYNDLEGDPARHEPYQQVFYYGNDSDDKQVELTITSEEFNKINEKFWNEFKSYIKEPTNAADGCKFGESIEKFCGHNIEEVNTVLLVGGSTRIYKIRDILIEIFGSSKIDTSLNADTCVAQGAAYHAAAECKYLSDASQLTFSDIIPFCIGIEVQGSMFEAIIKDGSTIPTTADKTFTTMVDGQKSVIIKVAQGLRARFEDNHYLGNFVLELSNPQPRGVPQIKVVVQVQPNNQFTVIAKEEPSGKTAKADFNRYDASLSPEKIKEMKDSYEKHKAEDEKLKELFALQSHYNSIVYQAKQTVNGIEDESLKKSINSEIVKLEAWYGANKDHTVQTLQKRIDEFNSKLAELTGGEVPKEAAKEEDKDEL
ncbi:Heat shock protein [Cucumispora dikerogammari]|nr:Heat shock protein [Cucumispora dikerogammari]